MSAETKAIGSVVCLSLTYYLQPNSGAVIKVLMENEHNEVIVVGTATAPLGDIQVMDDTLISSAYTVVCELYYVCCVCVNIPYVTVAHDLTTLQAIVHQICFRYYQLLHRFNRIHFLSEKSELPFIFFIICDPQYLRYHEVYKGIFW